MTPEIPNVRPDGSVTYGNDPSRYTSDTQEAIAAVCDEIKSILVRKNVAYGDSALDPVRIFSSAGPREQLLVRIDDKLSRIARGGELGEDVVLDLIGYLVLLRVSDRSAADRADAERDAAFEREKDDMLGKLADDPLIAVERIR